jgi:hypothetical protein
MTSTAVRHWFLPHKANGHRAHLLRPAGLTIFAGFILVVQLVYNLSVAGRPLILAYASDINAGTLFSQTNTQREAAGLPPLQLNSKLTTGALNKANDMFAKDYWSHYAPDGTPPWAFFTAAGYQYSYAGENLAKDFDTSSGVMDGWMNSPDHRANILNTHYTQVGFAVVNGTLQGEQTTLVVAFYAAPLAATTPVRAKPVPTIPVAVSPAAQTPAPVSQSQPQAAAPQVNAKPQTPEFSNTQLGASNTAAPAEKSYTLFKPLSVTDTLNWGQQLTVALLGLLLLLYLIHHYYSVRRKLGKPHHSYSLVQAAMLLIAIGFIAIGSFGAVG